LSELQWRLSHQEEIVEAVEQAGKEETRRATHKLQAKCTRLEASLALASETSRENGALRIELASLQEAHRNLQGIHTEQAEFQTSLSEALEAQKKKAEAAELAASLAERREEDPELMSLRRELTQKQREREAWQGEREALLRVKELYETQRADIASQKGCYVDALEEANTIHREERSRLLQVNHCRSDCRTCNRTANPNPACAVE